MFVLDTNILIYFFKGIGRVAERMLAVPPREIALPSIVVYEIEVGIAKSLDPRQRRDQFREFLNIVNVLPFSMPEAKCAAEIRADLESRSEPIGPHDVLIAGTALANNATMVTHNTSEFSRIKGLSVIDWF